MGRSEKNYFPAGVRHKSRPARNKELEGDHFPSRGDLPKVEYGTFLKKQRERGTHSRTHGPVSDGFGYENYAYHIYRSNAEATFACREDGPQVLGKYLPHFSKKKILFKGARNDSGKGRHRFRDSQRGVNIAIGLFYQTFF